MDLGVLGQGLAGGYLNTLPPNASREEQIAAINDMVNRLNSMLKTQVYSDGESKRYIQGFSNGRWPGGDFGIAISKPGGDVTLVDFSDLLYAWDFSTNTQYYYDIDSGKLALMVGQMEDKNMAFKVFDTNGVPVGLFGQSPKDRHSGDWVVDPGENVDTELKI